MKHDRNEFLVIGWIGLLGIFAAGFMLADGINTLREGKDVVAHVFLGTMFLLIARSDARASFAGGRYVRGWFAWRLETAE
jgi:hypothetical protein